MGMTGEAVTVSGDAQTVIDQMRGASLVHSPAMLALHRRASRLAQHFGNLSWVWTPRRNNKAADLLTRKAMRQVRFDFQRYQELVLDPLDDEPDVYRSNKIHPLMDLRVYLSPAVQGVASAARSPSSRPQQQ
jgi:hypothetical protein